jgi:hypothetical protein
MKDKEIYSSHTKEKYCEIDGKIVEYSEMKSLEEYERNPNPTSCLVSTYLGIGTLSGKTYHFWR